MEQTTNKHHHSRCGSSNQPGSLYCNQCGQWLSSWRPIQTAGTNSAFPIGRDAAFPISGNQPLSALTAWLLQVSSWIGGFSVSGVVLGSAGSSPRRRLARFAKVVTAVVGKGFAIAAIVIGALSFFGALAVLIWYLPSQYQVSPYKTVCASRAETGSFQPME